MRSRYFTSKAPPYDRYAQATDGLDGVLFDGIEVGAKRRAELRREAERARRREQAWDAWGEEDERWR